MKDKLVKLGLTEEQAQKVVDNFGSITDGLYVTKERFNEVNNELKTANNTIKERDTQLEQLKSSSENVDDLKKKIEDLQKENKEAAKKAKTELEAERKSNAVKLELMSKVHNPEVAMKLLNLDNVVMDESGKVKSGLKEQLDDLKKTDSYLFVQETPDNDGQGQNQAVKGATPKDGEGTPQTNLSKAELFAKNLAKGHNEAIKATADSSYFND